MLKNSLLFQTFTKKKKNLRVLSIKNALGLRMRNFQGIVLYEQKQIQRFTILY